jgi:hypothetical protein
MRSMVDLFASGLLSDAELGRGFAQLLDVREHWRHIERI